MWTTSTTAVGLRRGQDIYMTVVTDIMGAAWRCGSVLMRFNKIMIHVGMMVIWSYSLMMHSSHGIHEKVHTLAKISCNQTSWPLDFSQYWVDTNEFVMLICLSVTDAPNRGVPGVYSVPTRVWSILPWSERPWQGDQTRTVWPVCGNTAPCCRGELTVHHGLPADELMYAVSQKHTNSVLQYFEYFCQMSSKLILIILSYSVSKTTFKVVAF